MFPPGSEGYHWETKWGNIWDAGPPLVDGTFYQNGTVTCEMFGQDHDPVKWEITEETFITMDGEDIWYAVPNYVFFSQFG